MAGCTKGKWKVGEPFGRGQDYPLYAEDHYEIVRVFIHNGEQEANAHLIAAAVNACVKLNPDNPMAVAESIGKLYEALKALFKSDVLPIGWKLQVRRVLAKAEGKSFGTAQDK